MKNLLRRSAIVLPALLIGSAATLGMYAHASSTPPAATISNQSVVATVPSAEQADGTGTNVKDTDNLQVQDGSQNGADGEQADGVDVGHVDAGQNGVAETPDAPETGTETASGN